MRPSRSTARIPVWSESSIAFRNACSARSASSVASRRWTWRRSARRFQSTARARQTIAAVSTFLSSCVSAPYDSSESTSPCPGGSSATWWLSSGRPASTLDFAASTAPVESRIVTRCFSASHQGTIAASMDCSP